MLNDIPQAWLDEIGRNPDSAFSKKALAVRNRLGMLRVSDTIKKTHAKSQIGTRLVKLFADKVGAVPCSACKSTMMKLNQMAVEHVQAKRDQIIAEIERNATEAKIPIWAKFLLYVDTAAGGHGTRWMLGEWLDQACSLESQGCGVQAAEIGT